MCGRSLGLLLNLAHACPPAFSQIVSFYDELVQQLEARKAKMAASASPAVGGMGVSTPPMMGDVSTLSPGALGFIPEEGTPPGSSLRSMMPNPKISIEVSGPDGGQRPGPGTRQRWPVAGRTDCLC